MEALAAAASIAGVFSLTGQCIDGCVKLSGFFSDLSSASKTIDRFLHDINTLLRVLYDVEELASKIYSQTEPSFPDYYVRLLQTELEDCKKDVFKWLEIARQLRPASNRGRRAWFKKFWIAVNQRSVNNIRGDIARHKQTIELKLSLLGRYASMGSHRNIRFELRPPIGTLTSTRAAKSTKSTARSRWDAPSLPVTVKCSTELILNQGRP